MIQRQRQTNSDISNENEPWTENDHRWLMKVKKDSSLMDIASISRILKRKVTSCQMERLKILKARSKKALIVKTKKKKKVTSWHYECENHLFEIMQPTFKFQ